MGSPTHLGTTASQSSDCSTLNLGSVITEKSYMDHMDDIFPHFCRELPLQLPFEGKIDLRTFLREAAKKF